jgi:hypothetical protein
MYSDSVPLQTRTYAHFPFGNYYYCASSASAEEKMGSDVLMNITVVVQAKVAF